MLGSPLDLKLDHPPLLLLLLPPRSARALLIFEGRHITPPLQQPILAVARETIDAFPQLLGAAHLDRREKTKEESDNCKEYTPDSDNNERRLRRPLHCLHDRIR